MEDVAIFGIATLDGNAQRHEATLEQDVPAYGFVKIADEVISML